MSVFGLCLVLSAAFCHATWNFFVKRVNGGPELIWLFSTVSALIYLPLAAYVVAVERPSFDMTQVLFLLGSVALHLGYFLLLQVGYRTGDLSLVYPTARATGPVLSTCFAVIFLDEIVTPQMLAGAGIIIFGVLMLTGGSKHNTARMSSSLLFGLGAGTLIGSYTAWDAYSVSVLLIPPLLLDYASSLGRVVLLAPYAARHRALVQSHWRDHRPGVLAIAVFNPLAYILVLYALAFTPVAYVAPTREISVLLSVLAGSLLLGEGQLFLRIKWALVILIGVGILAIG